VRQFLLRYADNTPPPAQLPALAGLLHARRSLGELRLTIAAADDRTQQQLWTLGASSVEEMPVAFDDALIGYMGHRGERHFFLEDTTALETAGDGS